MLVTVRQGDVGDVGERGGGGGAAVRLFAKPVGSREAELGSKTERLLLHIRLDRFVLYFDYIVLFFLTETCGKAILVTSVLFTVQRIHVEFV